MTRLSGKPERPPPPPRDATRPPGGESAPLPRLGPVSRSFPHPPRPATPPARSPLLGGGRRGRGSRPGARGRCPTCLRRGRPEGCRFPSCPPRSVPPRSAWRPGAPLGDPPPFATGPLTASLRVRRGPRPEAQALRVGAGRGSPRPTHASPRPQPGRLQGPRRRPLPRPLGLPPPRGGVSRGAPGTGRPTLRHHHPDPPRPHPLGQQCQRQLPRPRTYLHGSTKPRVGGAGKLPPSSVSHWPV